MRSSRGLEAEGPDPLRMDCELVVKVDVYTPEDYFEGLPCMLDILRERGVKASIFFSMGLAGGEKQSNAVSPKNFFSKILPGSLLEAMGLMKSGREPLSKEPLLVESSPDILKRALSEGHDCGIHPWNCGKWKSGLEKMSQEEIRSALSKALEYYMRISGSSPSGFAAPDWRLSADALAVQDDFGFEYCSDTRGFAPFVPRVSGSVFRTLQIPSTLPRLGEHPHFETADAEALNDKYLDLLEPGLNVYSASAELEGRAMRGFFVRFLDCCVEGEIKFATLRDVASRYCEQKLPPVCDIVPSEYPGYSGRIAVQKTL